MSCPRIAGAFYTLAEPIEYEAPDEKPVDLVFVLLVPKEEKNAHIVALQRLAQLFSKASHLSGLRNANAIIAVCRLVRIDDTLSAAISTEDLHEANHRQRSLRVRQIYCAANLRGRWLSLR